MAIAHYPVFILQNYISSLTTHYAMTHSEVLHTTGLNNDHLDNNNIWFYPYDTHCFKLFGLLNDVGYARDYELCDLMLLDGLMAGDDIMQRSCFSALHNAPTLGEFLRRFLFASKGMPSHRHWIETRPRYVRLYQDYVFQDEAYTGPQGLFYLLLKDIYALFDIDHRDIEINFAKRGIGDEKRFLSMKVKEFDCFGSVSFIQFNLDPEKQINRYHNPFLDKAISRSFRQHFESKNTADLLPDAVEALLKNSLQSHNKMMTACDIARHLNVSKSTFYRRLDAHGVTFTDIQRKVRSDLAKQMLTEQKLSITSISDQLGFSCSNAFTRAFKQNQGISPSEYRTALDKMPC